MKRGGAVYSKGALPFLLSTPRSHLSPRRACPALLHLQLWWPNKGISPPSPSSCLSANNLRLNSLISSSQKHCGIPFFLINSLVFPIQYLPAAAAQWLQTASHKGRVITPPTLENLILLISYFGLTFLFIRSMLCTTLYIFIGNTPFLLNVIISPCGLHAKDGHGKARGCCRKGSRKSFTIHVLCSSLHGLPEMDPQVLEVCRTIGMGYFHLWALQEWFGVEGT